MAKTTIRKEQGGAPKGGLINYVLRKISGADYDYDWFPESGGAGGGTKLLQVISPQSIPSGGALTTLYSVTIPGGTLGANESIRWTIIPTDDGIGVNNGSGLTIEALYGGSSIGTIGFGPAGSWSNKNYSLSGMIFAAGVSNQYATIDFQMDVVGAENSYLAHTGTLAVNSAVDQILLIRGRSTGGTNGTLQAQGILIEKITQGGSGTRTSGVINVTPSSAPSTTVIAHGLGTIPTYGRFTAFVTGTNQNLQSVGTSDGTNDSAVGMQGGTGDLNTTVTSNSECIYVPLGVGTILEATVTYDATNITINWNVASGSTNTSLLWEVFI